MSGADAQEMADVANSRPSRLSFVSDLGEEETEVDDEEFANDDDKNACLHRAMTVWGILFDVFTALISLTDVASDIVVAVQFFKEGHDGWGGMVIASLVLSNIIYSVFAVEVLVRRGRWFGGLEVFGDNHSSHSSYSCGSMVGNRVIQYLVVFPIAQLFPVLFLIGQNCWPNPDLNLFGDDERMNADWDGEEIEPEGEEMDAARNQLIEEKAHVSHAAVHSRAKKLARNRWKKEQRELGDKKILGELAEDSKGRAVMERLDKAWMKHMETHLLVYVETVVESIPQSVIQLLAITFLGQATNIQVLSMSLSLVSIVSKGYVVSRSSNIQVVIWKFLLAAHDVFALFYIFSTIVAKEQPAEVALFGNEGIFVTRLTYGWLVAVVICCGFGLIAAIWLLGRRIADEMGYCDRYEVLAFVFVVLGCVLLTIPIIIAALGCQLLWVVGLVVLMEPQPSNIPQTASTFQFINSAGSGEERDKRILFLLQKWYPQSGVSKSWEVTKRLQDVMEERPFRASRLTSIWSCQCRLHGSTCRKMFEVYLCICIGVYSALQLYTLAYPWISYSMGYDHQNRLQQFCFIAMAIPTGLSLLFLPRAWNYFWFLYQMRVPLVMDDDTADVFRTLLPLWVTEYHAPPHQQLLRKILPSGLFPRDLVDHCSKFVKSSDLVVDDLSPEECLQLRDERQEEDPLDAETGPERRQAWEMDSNGNEIVALTDDDVSEEPNDDHLAMYDLTLVAARGDHLPHRPPMTFHSGSDGEEEDYHHHHHSGSNSRTTASAHSGTSLDPGPNHPQSSRNEPVPE